MVPPAVCLHRFALALCALCYALLLLGGHVHNTGSSLACGTDWPRCHGVWMPVMKGGVLLEHSHRILAGLVGLGAVVLAIWLALDDRRRGARSALGMALSVVGFVVAQLAGLMVFASLGPRHGEAAPGDVPVLAFGLGVVGLLTFGGSVAVAFLRRQPRLGWGLLAVGLVVAQGLLGALTVAVGLSPAISTAHLGTSMLFFAVLLVLAVRTRPARGAGDGGGGATPIPARLRTLVAVALGGVYLQMLLGAVVRHLGAGMICGREFPLCMGTVWPGEAHPGVYLHILHRALGVALLLGSFYLAAVVRAGSADPAVRRAALAFPALMVLQVALGILAVYTVLNAHTVTTHLGVAAAALADLVWLLGATRGVDAAREPAVASGHGAALKTGAA